MKDPLEGPASVPEELVKAPSPALLNARRGGSGPPLVVLHGLFGDLGNFHSVSLHLARHLEVCRVDLPGHGDSPTLARLGIEDMAERVVTWMAHAEIGRCHLLGHSLGGKVAMAIAGLADGPELASLIVVDIAPRHYPPHHRPILEALASIELGALADRREADGRLRAGVPDAGVRAFLLKSLVRAGDEGYRWRFDLDGIARDYALMCEAPRVANTITVPTLFIKGGESDYLAADDELPIRAICRDPTLREIGGAGHWPHAEKPALFTRVCLDFTTSADKSPAPAHP